MGGVEETERMVNGWTQVQGVTRSGVRERESSMWIGSAPAQANAEDLKKLDQWCRMRNASDIIHHHEFRGARLPGARGPGVWATLQ